MKKSPLANNLITCLMVGILGMFLGSLQSAADIISTDLVGTAVMVGAYLSAYAAGMFMSNFFAGALGDRLGKVRTILLCLAIAIAGLAAVAAAPAHLFMLAALFVVGFGYCPLESIPSAYLSETNGKRGTFWVNFSQLAFCLGAIVAPSAASGYISAGGSYRLLFALLAALFVPFLFYYLVKKKNDLQKTEGEKFDPNMFTVLKDKNIVFVVVMAFLYMGFETVAAPYTKLLMLEQGAADGLASLAVSVFWTAMIAGRLLGLGMGGKELFAVRFFPPFAVAGAAVILLFGSPAASLIGIGLMGFGCGPCFPMLLSLSALAAKGRSAAAVSVTMLSVSAGYMLFPVLTGTLLDSPALTLLIAGCCAVAMLAVSAFAKKPA